MTPSSPAPHDPEVERQIAILKRGAVDVISEDTLRMKLARSLKTGTPLRVKLGVDPTSPSLHLGFTVVLNKLRDFQDLGHQAVLILGDATAMVGDPTGRNKTRPRLTFEEVRQHAADYLEQARKVIDVDQAEIHYNSEWLHGLDFSGMVQLLSRYTVARMLERDDFSKRYGEGVAIYLHEFLYPLLQGYDSVAIKADVELGGTDQLFNLLVGRDLQGQEGQEPQVCLTTPLLVGLDGKLKMSKSYGNSIGIQDPADTMFADTMRVDDTLMLDWFRLLTREDMDEIEFALKDGANPRDLKLRLSSVIVERYHGLSAATEAREGWLSLVSRKEIPEDLPEVSAALGEPGLGALELLLGAFTFGSKSEARRLMQQGGVTLDGTKLKDPHETLILKGGEVLRAGKKRIARIADL